MSTGIRKYLVYGLAVVSALLVLQGPASAQLIRATAVVTPSSDAIIQALGASGQQWCVKQALLQQKSTPPAPVIFVPDAQVKERMAALHTSIPLELNPQVRQYIELYLTEKRESFEIVLGLGEQYFPMIRKELEAAGLPQELQYLPVALSALNPRYEDETGGAGLWHLPYFHALRYHLSMTPDMDARRDPALSTRAAVKLLRDLYARHHNWYLAVAAFTSGPAGLRAAQGRAVPNAGFWEMSTFLPEKTRDYVPAFIAAVYACKYYQEHNLVPLRVITQEHTETVTETRTMQIPAVAQILKIDADRLRDLNPVLRGDVIPFASSYSLSLPFGQRNRFAALRDSIYKVSQSIFAKTQAAQHVTVVEDDKVVPDTPDDGKEENEGGSDLPDPADLVPAGYVKIIYKIRSGDNLGIIADKFDVGLTKLKSWNGLSSDKIRAGATLDVYVPAKLKTKYESIAKGTTTAPSGTSKPSSAQGATEPRVQYYTVKSGDNLWSICKKYPGVTEKQIMDVNKITEKIYPGQRLIIPSH